MSITGAIIAGGISAASKRATNRKQGQLAQDQMDYQGYMSNTSYQRAMEDMRRAGLNPMLAYQQGGASSPQGAMAQLQDPGSAGVQGATSAYQAGMQGEKIQEEIPLIREEARKTTAEVDMTDAQTKQYSIMFHKTLADMDKTEVETRIAELKEQGMTMDLAIQTIVTDMYKEHEWLAMAQELGIGPEKLIDMFGDTLGRVIDKLLSDKPTKETGGSTREDYTKRGKDGRIKETGTRTKDSSTWRR
jgi:acyl-CoA thioesterase FadM